MGILATTFVLILRAVTNPLLDSEFFILDSLVCFLPNQALFSPFLRI